MPCRAAVRREHPAKRDLRWLTEDFVFYLPFVGASLNRLGAVRACQENAERLLSRERIIGVFPEGAKGIGKLFGERYRLWMYASTASLASASPTPVSSRWALIA